MINIIVGFVGGVIVTLGVGKLLLDQYGNWNVRDPRLVK